MTATVIKMSVQRMVCTGCGAEANASCNCGKTYIPAAARAAAAVAATPEKSDRAIATDIGVSRETVRQARGDNHLSPDRVGRDGKSYPAKRRRGTRMPEFTEEPQHDRDLRMLQGVWDGACETARDAFLAWVRA